MLRKKKENRLFSCNQQQNIFGEIKYDDKQFKGFDFKMFKKQIINNEFSNTLLFLQTKMLSFLIALTNYLPPPQGDYARCFFD